MKQFYTKVLLFILAFGLATPTYSVTAAQNYKYFESFTPYSPDSDEATFYHAVTSFHGHLKALRATKDSAEKKSEQKKMQAAYELMRKIAGKLFPRTHDSYTPSRELLKYAQTKLDGTNKSHVNLDDTLTKQKKRPAASRHSRHTRHSKHASKPVSGKEPLLLKDASGHVRPQSPVDTKSAERFRRTRDFKQTPRRKEQFLSPSGRHALRSSQKSRVSRSTHDHSKTHDKRYQPHFMTVTQQKGVDCAYHAAKTAHLLAGLLGKGGLFNPRDYTSPSQADINELKEPFKADGRDALDGENMKTLLISLFSRTSDSDAGFFLHKADHYVCAQVDWDATVKAEMKNIVEGCELVRKMQRAKMSLEDVGRLTAKSASKSPSSGRVVIDERSDKTVRKNNFTLHSHDIPTLQDYQEFLKHPDNSPLVPLADFFSEGKNLLLVWQRHDGNPQHTGHWITILINGLNVYIFDSLNIKKHPRGFTTFLKHLPSIPSRESRERHTTYLTEILG